MIFDDFFTKNDENQGNRRKINENQGNRGKIRKNMVLKLKNESCREFSGDHDPALFRGRKNIKPDRAGRAGTGNP